MMLVLINYLKLLRYIMNDTTIAVLKVLDVIFTATVILAGIVLLGFMIIGAIGIGARFY